MQTTLKRFGFKSHKMVSELNLNVTIGWLAHIYKKIWLFYCNVTIIL